MAEQLPPPEDGLYLVTAQGNVTMFEWLGPPSDAEALKKMPRTKDGALVVPGVTRLWMYCCELGRVAAIGRSTLSAGRCECGQYAGPTACYSTREAAEAAESNDES